MFVSLSQSNLREIVVELARDRVARRLPYSPFEKGDPRAQRHCLSALYEQPDSDRLPQLEDRAAALFVRIIKTRPFPYGNRRLAVVTLLVLLQRNGHWLEVDQIRLAIFTNWVAESDAGLENETIAAAAAFIRNALSPNAL